MFLCFQLIITRNVCLNWNTDNFSSIFSRGVSLRAKISISSSYLHSKHYHAIIFFQGIKTLSLPLFCYCWNVRRNTIVSVGETKLVSNRIFVPNINISWALLSKVICIFFALHSVSLLRFVTSLRISRHFFIQSGLSELKPVATNHKRYPAVCAGYMHLVRAAI